MRAEGHATKKTAERRQDQYTACWVLWSRTDENTKAVQEKVDEIFSGSFYPEIEWNRFGCRPPENYPLIGAWRDHDGEVFAFLLDDLTMVRVASNRQMILYLAGGKDNVQAFEGRIRDLKEFVSKAERKDLAAERLKGQVEDTERSQLLRRLLKLVAFFTVIVNDLPPVFSPVIM